MPQVWIPWPLFCYVSYDKSNDTIIAELGASQHMHCEIRKNISLTTRSILILLLSQLANGDAIYADGEGNTRSVKKVTDFAYHLVIQQPHWTAPWHVGQGNYKARHVPFHVTLKWHQFVVGRQTWNRAKWRNEWNRDSALNFAKIWVIPKLKRFSRFSKPLGKTLWV